MIIGAGTQDMIPIRYSKTDSFKIEHQTTTNCAASPISVAHWTLYSGYLYDELVTLNSTNLDNLDISIAERTLDYGMYKVCVTVAMTIDDRFQTTECGYLNIVASPLKATLAGGGSVQASNKQNVSFYQSVNSKLESL